jgi:hypothetical protein
VYPLRTDAEGMMRGCMTLNFSSVTAVVSLLVSVTVAWLTLFRRGNLYMTRPVQIIFRSENARRPEVILRTLLYATGKRGYVIEGLYLEVLQRGETHTFGFWSYRQGSELIAASGLRVGEDGIAFDNHFLEADQSGHFYFPEGKYEIRVYATVVNPRSAKLLHTIEVTLSEEQSQQMHIRNYAAVFTFDPQVKEYIASLSDQPSIL